MSPMPRFTRRAFLRGALATLTSGAGATLYAYEIEPYWLDVVRQELTFRRLPDAFAGFTIAQISDLHFGKYMQAAQIDPAIDAVLSLNADVIVITGDLVSRVDHGEPEMMVQVLSRLHAAHGVYAILGNHDWWEDGPIVMAALRRAGITVLTNEHVSLQRGGQNLYLAGIDDVWCQKNDLGRALQGIPSASPTIALVHEPDYADVVANDPRVLLQLSGHSHGGQVRVPFYGGLRFPPLGGKYTMGLYQIRDLTLYTNRGIGVVGLPIRFACRPEVTLFTLKPMG